MKLLLLYLLYAVVLSLALRRAGHRSGRPAVREGTPSRPARILIVGATGGTGRHLVAQALERGYAVTAVVRDPARLEVAHPALTVVRGDVLDAASVDSAMRGQDAVVSALGHKRYLGPSRILSEGTKNLLRAMEAHGVPRLVCETSLGIGDSAFRMGIDYTFFTIPVILPFYFWDKTRQERAIASSSVDWVIVRPAVLTNGARSGRIRHGLRAGSFLWAPRISRADTASFLLDQLASDEYLRAAPGVTG